MPDEDIEQSPEQETNGAAEEETGDGQVLGSDWGEDELESAGSVVDDGSQAVGPPSLPYTVVGIGGSAGGIEAYIEVFRNIPSNTGMVFVLIPHLMADQRSYLREIMARHTTMPVVSIEDGIRPEPNHVYLLPPNAQVYLQNGLLRLEERSGDGAFRPIDRFFQSLATEQRSFAIGVVLSGMDADGSIGLRVIRGEGGIAIVQAPETARFPEMPRSSISADHVDVIVPPDAIGRHLAELAKRQQNPEWRQLEEGSARPQEERYFGRILKLLKGVSGVDFRLYKPNTLRRRIARRMLMHRSDTLAEYLAFLHANFKEQQDLQEDILISVTRFFRDPEVFEALKETVLPQIFEDRSPDQQVRIWVPGCSSGEEVYSIAICLLEYLSGRALEPPIQIFGTDASEHSVRKARLGIYPESIASEVSPERLRRFFSKAEKGYQVSKRIRDLCIFARQNLCQDPPFSRLDLISCRNVLIYFGSQLQKQLIPTFHYALRQDGFLLLGSSETIREFSDLFGLVDRKHKIYSKIGSTPRRALVETGPRLLVHDFPSEPRVQLSGENFSEVELQRTADRIILARYGPPGVIVNDKLEILQSRGHTSAFLELAVGAASLHLGRMIRETIAPQVTAAVKRAIEHDLPVQVEELNLREDGQQYELTLEVLPMHNLSSRTKCYLVLFVPSLSRSGVSMPSTVQSLREPNEDEDPLISYLQHELSSTKLHLQSLFEERDTRSQELVSANEEIQSANEELQSTNEELETTKEELQSSNEELQTVNDELQNRNSVLTQASNDLSNLLNSVNLPVLMLSNEFNIRHFTPQTQRLMNVRVTDVGRPFSDIRLNLNIDNLEPLFTEVLDTLGAREIEVQDRDGRWYLLRVRPYRTTENKIDGLVVMLVDIDQVRRTQQELLEARDFARSIIEGIPLPLAVIDSEFRIRSTNEAFCALANSSAGTLERRSLPDLAARLWGMAEPLGSALRGLRDNAKQGRSFEIEHKTSGESPKVFLIRGRVLKSDGEQFLLVTFEDVTAHKEVERLLKVESERLANEVNSATKELDRSREELRALTGSLMTSQEDERRRLARELHDDISQRLAALSMLGDKALADITKDPMTARQELQQTLTQLGELSEEVRSLSHRLHPSMIEDLGLATALRSLTEEFGEREEMITTFFSRSVPETLPIEVATGLYRIAQEAFRNIAKHAGKTHVKVSLTGKDHRVQLRVADAGKGFDTERKRSGLGLTSIQERARLIGGTANIQSAPGEGTKITVSAPLPVQ